MARRPADEPPDPYEIAVHRIESDRRSREMGDPMPALPPGLDVPLPGRRMHRTIWLLAGALVLLVVGRLATSSRTPTLAADCTRAQFKLSSSEVRTGGPVRWSATGPADTPVEVRVDQRRTSEPGITLAGCKASGAFLLVGVAAGKHTVSLLNSRTGSRLAAAALTVTG